nr:unnamed protein product [Callosobruchus analis]
MASSKPYEHKVLLDYILAHAKDDERPYLSVDILGLSFLGLLDSGASKTVLGGSGWKQLASSLQLDESVSKHCTVANGEKCEVLGKVSLPIRLQDRVKDVQTKLRKAYERSSQRYNLRRRPDTFKLGQQVWKRNITISDAAKGYTSKLSPKFEGPYRIVRVVSPWAYELVDPAGKTKGVWSAHDLKAHPPEEV